MSRWSSILAVVRAWVPTSFWTAALVQTVFLIALAASDGYDVARTGEVARVVLTYASILAVFGAVHLLIPDPRRSRGVAFGVFFLFVSINFARFETAGTFDYGFAQANIRELASPLGRHIVFSNVRAWEIACLFLLPLAAGASLARWPSPPWPGSPRVRRVALSVCLALLLGLPAARVSTHESLTGFAASALRFYAESRTASATIKGSQFPFVREYVPSQRAREIAGHDAPRPHVLLLFMESWSAVYQDKARPDGRMFTPVFDARRREGLSYDHFYGNSVQSSRGHFATLCSLMPMLHGKEFVNIPDTRLHCLPRVLGDVGYRSLFFSANDEPEFDSAATYLPRIGFADVRFEPDRHTTENPAVWGMGLQDDVFYRRVFAALDEEVARSPAPVFAVLTNASNHYPFDKNPKHVPDSGYPTKYRRNYVASLTASDAWLVTFFDELERRPAFRDAIVVLVGDHSFPADEHGIHFNGLGAFEEAFHTGFALRWYGHVAPERVVDRAASQLDIAPTIIDLLQLRTKTHFVGHSLVSGVADTTPVPLVQPYDGVRLAAVRWPFKLVRHESAEQEHLYDLSRDRDEEHDLLHDQSLAGVLGPLRETLARVHASEAVLRENRVWPPP